MSKKELTNAERRAIQAFYWVNRFREEMKEIKCPVWLRQSFANIEWSIFYAIRDMPGNKEITMPEILRKANFKFMTDKINDD